MQWESIMNFGKNNVQYYYSLKNAKNKPHKTLLIGKCMLLFYYIRLHHCHIIWLNPSVYQLRTHLNIRDEFYI